MNRSVELKKKYIVGLLALMLLSMLSIGIVNPTRAQATPTQLGVQQITLNPGGGILDNATDGLRFTINSDGAGPLQLGQDDVLFRNTTQYCCGAASPYLNIGGTLYGQVGAAFSSGVPWDTIAIVSTSGATSTGALTSATGNASAVIRYSVVHSARTYSFDRTVTYTYPNNYVTDSYSFTIPSGNTDPVKFYFGGDTAPGGSDSGYGIMLTSPVRSVISLNTSSNILFGFREVSGSRTFSGATSQDFTEPYDEVGTGGDIGFVVEPSTHDAGLMMQWNLGSTPGTFTGSFEQFVNTQAANVTAAFSDTTADIGEAVQLDISIENTLLTSATGLGYLFSLPDGLVIGSGSQSNTCGGTLSAVAGSSTISLSGANVGAASNCVIGIPVVADANGTYTISSASVSSLAGGLVNNIGSSSFVVGTGVNEIGDTDGISVEVEGDAPGDGDVNGDGFADNDQDNVASFVNTVTGAYASLAVPDSCDITSVGSATESSKNVTDGTYDYPSGLMNFTLGCGTPGVSVTVTEYYFGTGKLAKDFVARKFTPYNNTYQTLNGAAVTDVSIGGLPAIKLVFTLVDGGQYDNDQLANGIIVDPAGLGIAPVVTTGTLPATGSDTNKLIIYALLLLSVGFVFLKLKQAKLRK